MVKVKLNKAISYKGKVYPANTMFTIKDIDLDELKKLGAFVIEDEADEEVTKTHIDVDESEEEEEVHPIKRKGNRRK